MEEKFWLTGWRLFIWHIKVHFTFIMSYNMPMTSVKEKMKHDFLHQEK